MAKFIPVPEDNEAVFSPDGIQFVGSGNVRSNEDVGRRGAVGADDGEIKRNAVMAALGGAVGVAGRLLSVYYEAPYYAATYKLKYALGVRAPESGYAPTLGGGEKKAIKSEVREGIEIATVKGKNEIVLLTEDKKGKTKKEKKPHQEVIDELTAQRLAEVAESKAYYNQVIQIVRDANTQLGDVTALFDKAVEMVKPGLGYIRSSFEAGQSVNGSIEREPNDIEKQVAIQCVLAEKAELEPWTAEKRRTWINKRLNDMARNEFVRTGEHLVQLAELKQLDELNVSGDTVDDIEDREKVILDVPVTDVTVAKIFGADEGSDGVELGVQMVLSQGNAVNVRLLGQNLRVSSGPDKLQPAVRLTRSAATLELVQLGELGGRKLRKVVNWILGKSDRGRIPLVGNLVIGSIEQGGDNIVIPMVNPLTAKEILDNIGSGVKLINSTTQRINVANPLVAVEDASLVQAAISATAGRIADLPNGRRIEQVAEKAVAKYSTLENELVSSYELKRSGERAVREGGQGIDTDHEKARQAAVAILNGEPAAKGYMQNRKTWEKNIRKTQNEDVADVYINALNERAEELLANTAGEVQVDRKGPITDDVLNSVRLKRRPVEPKSTVVSQPIKVVGGTPTIDQNSPLAKLPKKK
jgi:hypothetical protein